MKKIKIENPIIATAFGFLISCIVIAGIIYLLIPKDVTHNIAVYNKLNITMFVANQEGYSSAPYKDNTQYSVGHGLSTEWAVNNGWCGNYMSRSDAMRLLELRLIEDRIAINKRIAYFDSMPRGVIIATHSAMYNCPALVGPNYCEYLMKGEYANASMELAYGHEPREYMGLVKRRIAEANLIRDDIGVWLLPVPDDIAAFKALKEYWYSQTR